MGKVELQAGMEYCAVTNGLIRKGWQEKWQDLSEKLHRAAGSKKITSATM